MLYFAFDYEKKISYWVIYLFFICDIVGEDRDVERLSFKEMYEETKVYCAALRKMGVQNGDRVACNQAKLFYIFHF